MRQWAITIGDKKIDNEQYVGLHPENVMNSATLRVSHAQKTPAPTKQQFGSKEEDKHETEDNGNVQR